ncbi:lyase family protein, partial [Stenotrophomonas indicatrix]|uniref:lyase family protein n=2 Tax=Lysobacteraceae TaxID=32033 RepID=UPI0028B20FD0
MSHFPTLLGGLFGDPAVDAVFRDEARLQAMLDVERALVRAQVQCGVIPAAALAPIEAACSADLYSLPALSAATALAGNPAIPLVKALTAQVKANDAEAARWVHWGATSQDIIDTGAVLQLRAAVSQVQARLRVLCMALARLAEAERGTGLPGRTLLQQAVPVTFGLKAAGWLDALQRSQRRLDALAADTLVLQFGGAAG